MLNKKENTIMAFIFDKAHTRGSCLLTPSDLIVAGLPDFILTQDDVKKILDLLELDGYIEVVLSDKNGEKVYCISLKAKGEAFKRQKQISRKSLRNRILITVALAVLSACVTLIIKLILSIN